MGVTAIPLTASARVANMSAAEHDLWSVSSEFDTDADWRFGVPPRWVRLPAPTALASAPILV
jgi:hypothetical protein